MKEKILKKGVILPLVIGIVLAVAFSIFLHNTTLFQPVSDGTVMAYHDEIGADADIVEKDRISDYSANDCIGSISAGDEVFVVRYNADYANSASSLSFIGGTEIGKGISYLQTNSYDIDKLTKVKHMDYSGAFGEHKYAYSYSKEYPSKQALLSDNTDINKGIILVYQSVEGYGLSSSYTALAYEEVQ